MAEILRTFHDQRLTQGQRMTIEVEISDDGKGKHQSFSARWTLDVLEGMGLRNVSLVGWGATEIESREQLITQAMAARDNLTFAIEMMIEEKQGTT